ncbi:MAG: carbohydrate kinase family protein [Bryobacteraceae bacterium]|nr:carbohydrate kinase family protein [Bryobacteraceae bacterium]
MSGILCAGNAAWDTLVRPVDEIRWGVSVWVDRIEAGLGGNGANTAYTAAKLGAPAAFWGSIGEDEAGARIVQCLHSAGVILDYVRRSALPSAATVALVGTGGKRSFLHAPGASLEAYSPPEPVPDGFSHLHVANVFSVPGLRRAAPAMLAAARSRGWTTSVDTGWDSKGEWLAVLAPCLPLADFLFVNEMEACHLTNLEDSAEAARRLLEAGAACVILKRGEAGCDVIEPGGVLRMNGLPVEVMDTTGAGDCFAGGFLAARWRGLPHSDCARFANAVGALSVTALGATAGVRSWQETSAWLRRSSPANVPPIPNH